ncbi:TolC family protein [Flavobacterium sp.]|uniref:TolC family protein n=1 Tax=Flavobacterium sp. TaxID=239 RepID=UPI00404761E8
MNKISKVAFFLLISFFVKGQDNSWSLQKCIGIGLENSIQIKINLLEVKRTQKAKNSFVNEILPTVNLFGSQSYNFGSTIDPSTNGRVSSNIQYDNFYLNAQMNLLDFNKLANTQRDKINIEIAKADKEVIENEYKLQILESYYQTLFTQELLSIQKQQVVNSKNNLDRIQKEVNIGSKPKSDLYDIQFLFAKEEKQVVETEQLYIIQKTELFQLINFTDLSIEEVVLEKSITQIEHQTNSEEINNPKITVAKLNYDKNRKEIKAQRGLGLPTLSAFYQISSFYYKPLNQPNSAVESFSNQIENNKNQQIGLQLNIPIFNGFKKNKRVSVAKIEREKAKLMIAQENQKIKQQVEVEKKNLYNYLQLQEKLNEVENYANESFGTTQAKFTSGKADAFSYASSKNNLLSSEYDVLKNQLKIQFTQLKMNLIQFNQL